MQIIRPDNIVEETSPRNRAPVEDTFDRDLEEFKNRNKAMIEKEMANLTTSCNDTIGQEVSRRMDAELEDLEKYKDLLENQIRCQLTCMGQ